MPRSIAPLARAAVLTILLIASAPVAAQARVLHVGPGQRYHRPCQASQGKAIWVIAGNDTTIENIEFSGARVPDDNGAGIRQEGANLLLEHCYFHDNQSYRSPSARAGPTATSLTCPTGASPT